jgi:hypothetical protein
MALAATYRRRGGWAGDAKPAARSRSCSEGPSTATSWAIPRQPTIQGVPVIYAARAHEPENRTAADSMRRHCVHAVRED